METPLSEVNAFYRVHACLYVDISVISHIDFVNTDVVPLLATPLSINSFSGGRIRYFGDQQSREYRSDRFPIVTRILNS